MAVKMLMREKSMNPNDDNDDDFHAGETNINPDDAWTTTLPISMSERLFNWSRNQIVLFLHLGVSTFYMNNHIIIKQV